VLNSYEGSLGFTSARKCSTLLTPCLLSSQSCWCVKLLVPSVCSTGSLVIKGTRLTAEVDACREKTVTIWCFKQQLQHSQIHWLPLKDLAWIRSTCSRQCICIHGEACSRQRNSWPWVWEVLHLTESNKEGGESSAGSGEVTESFQCQ